jgi:hypothetical protein
MEACEKSFEDALNESDQKNNDLINESVKKK